MNRAHRRAREAATRHGRLGPARIVRPFVPASSSPEEMAKVAIALRLVKRRILELSDQFIALKLAPAHVGSALISMGIECYAITHTDDPAWNLKWSQLSAALEDVFNQYVTEMQRENSDP